MTRRISAHYVFPVSAPPVKYGIVEMDTDGTLLQLSDPGGKLRETSRLEFYDGILFPGFLLALPPYTDKAGFPPPGSDSFPAGLEKRLWHSGVNLWHSIREKEKLNGFPCEVCRLSFEKKPACGKEPAISRGFWLRSPSEKKILQSLSSLKTQDDSDFLVIDTSGWMSACRNPEHLNRLENFLQNNFPERKKPVTCLLSSVELPGGSPLPGGSVSLMWLGMIQEYTRSVSEKHRGQMVPFLHLATTENPDTSWLIRALYQAQSFLPGAGIAETLPLLTSGAAGFFGMQNLTGTFRPGEKTGLNLASGVDLPNLKWKAGTRIKRLV